LQSLRLATPQITPFASITPPQIFAYFSRQKDFIFITPSVRLPPAITRFHSYASPALFDFRLFAFAAIFFCQLLISRRADAGIRQMLRHYCRLRRLRHFRHSR